MSILGHSHNVVIDDAEISNAGRDVRMTTQHANSAFTSSSDQTIVMEQPNVLNAGGNITYITWNFQLLEMVAAALSLIFSPFRTRVSTTEPSQSFVVGSSSSAERDVNRTLYDPGPSADVTQVAERINSGRADLDIGVAMSPEYAKGAVHLPIHTAESAPISCKTFIESMLQLKIGYPMWNPQPHSDLPLGYRCNGISFGDLGITTDDGDFDFIFNVLLRANDPVNQPADLPDDFDVPNRPKAIPRFRTSYNTASTLSNLQHISTDLDPHSKDISCSFKDDAAGAILLLPQGAFENDLRNEWHWKQFVSKQAVNWYRYARENSGRDIDRHSLYFITGYMKSKSWGIMTFDTPASERNKQLLVMEKSEDPNVAPYLWKKVKGASVYKSGPSPDTELTTQDGYDDIANQCVFLRGFKISLSEQAWSELWDVMDTDIDITNKDNQYPKESGLDSDNNLKGKGKGKDESGSFSSSHGNLGNGLSLFNFPTRAVAAHPSNRINDILLSLVPDARVAITHDNVWMDVAREKNCDDKETLAATFGSQFIASYCQDSGMCTFEPVKELIPMFQQAGSLSEDKKGLLDYLTTVLDSWKSRGLANVAPFLELYTKILVGKEHSDAIISMNNLAVKYNQHGERREAEDIQTVILKVQAETLGKEHPDTITSMNNLALTYFMQGKLSMAENIQIQVLEMRTRILGKEHPDTLTSMNNLAVTYFEQGKWRKAESIQVQVMGMRITHLGEEHPHTLNSMDNLAVTYNKLGKCTEAADIQIRVLDMTTRNFGNEHPDTLTTMNNLALTYCTQEKFKEAEDIQVRVLDVCIRIMGKEHPHTLTSMNNLAVNYYKQRRWTDAENLLNQVLDIRRRTLGDKHPYTLTTVNHLTRVMTQKELPVTNILVPEKTVEHHHAGTIFPEVFSMPSDYGSSVRSATVPGPRFEAQNPLRRSIGPG